MATSVDEIKKIQSLEEENALLRAQLDAVQQQLDWFKRQLFGSKSEKRLEVDPAIQAQLFDRLDLEPPASDIPTEEIHYVRRKKQRGCSTVTDTGLRFDETVPVETIELMPEGAKDLPEDETEIIDEKVSYRLAQRPGSYVVLKYVRPVLKNKPTGTFISAPMPQNVLEKSVADVSVLAGILIDKFLYHLPLYRQHQRLQHSGITLSRTTIMNWVNRSIDLLVPIVDAQMINVLRSRVLAMDETPIKAGRKQKGKMRQAYIWPIYGELDEIVFRYTNTRAHQHVKELLGGAFSGTIVSDGYKAYERFAQASENVTNAQCWSHARRYFEGALEAEPVAAEEALSIIALLYRHEKIIKEKRLVGADKQAYRSEHTEPVVKSFWTWCEQQCQRHDLLPSDKLTKALKYAMNRRTALQVFLSDPDVPLDTNHVERELRVIPMGRRNWLFAWTEVGAERIAVIQSLLVTCKLHNVDPYVYLTDVLQRVSQHPANQVHELTPRLWKEKFADNPLRSDLDKIQCQ
jgi:transposase